MSEANKKDAAEHAARAAKQLKHAAKNAVEAAVAEKNHVVDEVSDGTEKAVEVSQGVVERLKPLLNVRIAGNLGLGAVGLAVVFVGATYAANRFGMAYTMRQNFLESTAKIDSP